MMGEFKKVSILEDCEIETTDHTEYIKYEPPFPKEEIIRFPRFELKYDEDYRNPCKHCPNFKEDEINVCLCALPALRNPLH